MRRALLVLAAGLALAARAAAPAADAFAAWVRDTHFAGYRNADPAARWDVPAANNAAHGDAPVLVRTARSDGPIELGDVLRLYEIDEPFVLVVGFFSADGAAQLTRIAAPAIDAATWRRLWGPVTYADLLKFDELIRDTGRPLEEIRRLALQRRAAPPFSEAVIQIVPRVDARQRRLVGVIRAEDFFRRLAPGTATTAAAPPQLWGVPYSAPKP